MFSLTITRKTKDKLEVLFLSIHSSVKTINKLLALLKKNNVLSGNDHILIQNGTTVIKDYLLCAFCVQNEREPGRGLCVDCIENVEKKKTTKRKSLKVIQPQTQNISPVLPLPEAMAEFQKAVSKIEHPNSRFYKRDFDFNPRIIPDTTWRSIS